MINWINGTNSVMGLMVGNFDTWLVQMGEGLKQLGALIVEFLLMPINLVIDSINGVLKGLNALPSVEIDLIKNISTGDVTGGALSGQASIKDFANLAVNNIAGPPSNTTTQTANITVNATGDPQAIAVAVENQMNRSFSSANTALQPRQK